MIHASGISIWKAVRAPTMFLFAISLLVALGAETVSTQINRQLDPRPPGQSSILLPGGEIWLRENSGDNRYILMATGLQPNGRLINVTVFGLNLNGDERIEASEAFLERGFWRFMNAIVRSHDRPARFLGEYSLPTSSTAAELSLRTSSPEDMTFFELAGCCSRALPTPDPHRRDDAAHQAAGPAAGADGVPVHCFCVYRGLSKVSNYGPAVLYGVVLGFVVFVITEMADRAGSTGVLDPTFAAVGPAFVAIVIGVTVLLHKEDGRA